MPTPTNRTPLRVARGTYSNLNGSLTDLQEGEITFATDEGKLYVKQGSALTSISSSSQAAPTPSDVTASPAFVSGAGTSADPFVITNGASPFAGGTLNSAQQITIANANPGDLVVFTDNSAVVSDRFKSQEVGTVNSAGNYTFKLNYTDTPNTTTDNTTYAGALQVGSVHFQWTVVQSNLTTLSQSTATTISLSSLGVGGTATATEGTVTGGTAPYTYATRWQRSFNGTSGWFDIGSAGTTYTIQSADSGYYIRAVTTGTDTSPSNTGGPLTFDIESAASGQINTLGPATVGSLVLTEDNTAGARYTSKTFSAVANLNPDGVPVTTKALKVKLDGTFSTFPETSNVTGITSNDDIGSNVNNSTNLIHQNNAGGDQNSSNGNTWTTHFVSSSVGGAAFVTFPTDYSSYERFKMFRSTYGIASGTSFGDANAANASYSPKITEGDYYIDDTHTTNRVSYQEPSGGNSSSGVHWSDVWKGDTILQYQNGPKWCYLNNVTSISGSNNKWKKINTGGNTSAQDATSGEYGFGFTSDHTYSVNCSQNNNTQATIHIMNGDICDSNATVTTTDLVFQWSSFPNYSTSSTNKIDGFFGHGSKITMVAKHYNNNGFDNYFYTCDFSVNNGSQISHWVKTAGPLRTNQDYMYSRTAVSGNNIVVQIGKDQLDQIYVSTNNGASYTNINVSATGWSIQQVKGLTFSRGRLIAMIKGTNQAVTGNTSYYYAYFMSSNNGSSWTPSLRRSTEVGGYNQYNKDFLDTMSKRGVRFFHSAGGYIFCHGRYNYQGTTQQYYRSLIYCEDSDIATLTDTTNLANNSFRSGNKVRQGSNTAFIGNISGSDVTLFNINGTISTGSPLTNTVNYFGGNISTMYGIINSAGTVTDLTSVDPSFVNLGYLADNTITFPATLPSGNTPDVELSAGTTITVSAQFANSQGTVSATSNTVTPA